jgi:hypothetical protein
MDINTDPASPDFNSYASVDDLTAFAASRGYDVPDEDQCPALLFQAMDYLNGLNWLGVRADPEQPLPWPRCGIYLEDSLLKPDVIPRQLVQAQSRLALAALDGELDGTLTRGVTMEMAGKVSLQYSGDADSGEVHFPWLSGLLRGLLSVAINSFAERA